jgi:hypothetical protein
MRRLRWRWLTIVVEITQVGDTCQEVERFQRNIAFAVRIAEKDRLCVSVQQRVASSEPLPSLSKPLVEMVYKTLTVRLNSVIA